MKNEYILGIDIGGTNFRIGLVNNKYEIIDFNMKSISELKKGDFIRNLVKEINVYLYEYKGCIEAIGIGFPSIISKDKMYIYSTPNIENLNNIEIVKELKKYINIPIFIDRDVNFLMIKDIHENKISNKNIVLGFYIGTGLGNVIYINDRILEGKHGVAGELGHIPTFKLDDLCSCGNKGCIEMIASGKALKNIMDKYYPNEQIDDIFLNHYNDEIIKEYISALSIPIATEINIFDPDYIIIAGGIPIMKNFPTKLFESEILKRVRKPYPANDTNILVSKHDQKSGILGVAYYIRKYIKEK